MVKVVRRRPRGSVPPGRLYAAIKRAGLTPRGFADTMGIHTSTLWRIDRGVAQPSESDWYQRAAAVLGVSVDEISPESDHSKRVAAMTGEVAADVPDEDVAA